MQGHSLRSMIPMYKFPSRGNLLLQMEKLDRKALHRTFGGKGEFDFQFIGSQQE